MFGGKRKWCVDEDDRLLAGMHPEDDQVCVCVC